MKAVLIISALLTVGHAQVEPVGDLCDPDYDCHWSYRDDYGVIYDFDFSHHCSAMGHTFTDQQGHVYSFNICGRSPRSCLPKGYTSRYRNGEVVQFFGDRPACSPDDNSTMCFDTVSQKYACCTQDCEVLGVGTPVWGLLDETNPSSGGILLTHTGVPPAANDPHACPINPATYAPYERSVTIIMHCDDSLPQNQLQINAAYENSTCEYVIDVTTKAACGCPPQCGLTKNCGPDGCGGFCSGPALSGNCPYGQMCMADQSCCRPDCTNRDCGDDGCGGTCGTCGADQTCTPQLVCMENTPFIPSAPEVFTSDSGGLTGSFFGGIITTVACAGVMWFFRHGGRQRFDAWRHGGSASGGDQQSLMTTPSGTATAGSTAGSGTIKSTGYGSYGT